MRRSWPCVLVLLGCGPAVAPSDDGTSSTSTGTTVSTTIGSATSSDPTASTSASTTTGTITDSSTSDGDTTTTETTTADPPPDLPSCAPVSCGGNNYACTDGEDNDDDGLVDMLDPGCISVCDDDEDAYMLGLPGDWGACNLDCAFDGNSGQGDDMCRSDIRCDEENPGELVGCEYLPSDNCGEKFPMPQFPECLTFCEPFVLPGCDCFGCCTFETKDGPVDLFIDLLDDCRPDNLAGCPRCTSQIEACGNPCTPESCEICIGAGLPDGCDTNTCDAGNTCTDQDDCACGDVCILGCCMPLPPG